MSLVTDDGVTDVNFARWLAQRAAEVPEFPAIKLGPNVLSYARLDDAVSRAVTDLDAAGVRAGDRVAIIMPNVLAFPIYYYAILRLGGVVVPMNPLLKAAEIGYVLHDAQVKVAVTLGALAEHPRAAAGRTGTTLIAPDDVTARLAELAPSRIHRARGEQDTAVILYTSGTTGSPKGAELTHRNITTNVRAVTQTLLPMGPGDVVFGGLPLFHSFGQTVGLNAAISAGACLTMMTRFDPTQALRIFAEDKVTIALGVPTMYVALLAASTEESVRGLPLRVAAAGGASLPLEVLKAVEARFGITLLEGYGLSETSPVASFNHPDRPTKPGTIGIPIRGCEFKLVDLDDHEVGIGEVGEICIRGENVMKGYLNRPEDTAYAMRGGWFHTGDLGTVDADGFYTIVDRLKDMIIRNGFNVYPREVEEVLYTHPAVLEAAVVGVPHPEHGEEIAAVVTLKEGRQATEAELIDYVRERVAAYKYPRIIKFGSLPKGPTGKILKRDISIDPDRS